MLLRRSRPWLVRIPPAADQKSHRLNGAASSKPGASSPSPHRHRQHQTFEKANQFFSSFSGSSSSRHQKRDRGPATSPPFHRRASVARVVRPSDEPSQRAAYRRQQESATAATASAAESGSSWAATRERASSAVDGVAGSYLTPLPSRYGFYDGIDEHGMESVRPSREERRHLLEEALSSSADFAVDFTEGGEADIDMNGLPASQYHGQAGWTTIPKDSALYSNFYTRGLLESRQRWSSWSMAMGRGSGDGAACSEVGKLLGEFAASQAPVGHQGPSVKGDSSGAAAGEDGATEPLDATRRRRQRDDGLYSTSMEGELLEPNQECIGQPRSTYAMRKLFVDGLVGYQGVISRAEETQVIAELLRLLQDPRAAYVAEEARYCVNLYEHELGIPGKDTLAFGFERCPTLQRVLHRLFFLNLIPSLPNVCQVSEMIGTFSGYPVHHSPPSIGPYVGLLNLVSTSVLHLQHRDCPWYPRVHMTPRSLFVVSQPCLGEYAIGYKQTHQPFHTFEYATRVSKDYRIEVLFATVETQSSRALSQAVALTDYATRRMAARGGKDGTEPAPRIEGHGECGGTVAPSALPLSTADGTDTLLEKVRQTLHAREHASTGVVGHRQPLDGAALRRELLAAHVVGRRGREEVDGASDPVVQCSGGEAEKEALPTATFPSAAKRRLAALKSRYNLAQQLQAAKQAATRTTGGGGPRLIRGHSPADRHMGIK